MLVVAFATRLGSPRRGPVKAAALVDAYVHTQAQAQGQARAHAERRVEQPGLVNAQDGAQKPEKSAAQRAYSEQHKALERRLEVVRAREAPRPEVPAAAPKAKHAADARVPAGQGADGVTWTLSVAALVLSCLSATHFAPAGDGTTTRAGLAASLLAQAAVLVVGVAEALGALYPDWAGHRPVAAARGLVLAVALQLLALAAGRHLWAAWWKSAEGKDLEIVLEWHDHGPAGERGRASRQLAFHARRQAFLTRPWGRSVRGLYPGFAFALYLRACLDLVLADMLRISPAAVGISACAVAASVPLLPSVFGVPTVWALAAAAGTMLALAVALALHLRAVVAALTPPVGSLRMGAVAPPPYMAAEADLRAGSKQDRLFLLGRQRTLDVFRAALACCALLGAAGGAAGGWQSGVALLPAVVAAAILAYAIGLYAISTSLENYPRRELIAGSNRAIPKRAAYRRIVQFVKVKFLQQQRRPGTSWPPRRLAEFEQICMGLGDTVGREETGAVIRALGQQSDERAVDLWFEFFAGSRGRITSDQLLELLQSLDATEDPLDPDAQSLFPPVLNSATELAKAFWDLGLDLHVDACNEMLRCLPEQTSAELLGWLASLDTL